MQNIQIEQEEIRHESLKGFQEMAGQTSGGVKDAAESLVSKLGVRHDYLLGPFHLYDSIIL